MRTLVIVCSFLFLSSAQLCAATCGGTVLCQCGDTVTKNYAMTADVGPCPGHGLVLASGVTLDGQQHRILGSGGGTEAYGIYLHHITGATVKNVIVSGFLRGLQLSDATLNTIVNSEFLQNGNVSTHVGYGIDVASGARQNTLRDNLIYQNADEGVHFGSGSESNLFTDNQVFDNYRENIYLLASHDNTFTDNRIWGGVNSFYVKDSSSNFFRGNTVRDKLLLVRADSHDNHFLDTTFWGAGIHFQVYTKGAAYRFPYDNEVSGGSINDALICLRFSSAWGNIVRNAMLSNCETELLATSDEAPSHSTLNMATGVVLSSEKIRLEGSSQLATGWRLTVHVQDEQQKPVANAHVRVRNAVGDEVFALQSDEQGDIPPQDVVTLVKTASTQISYTPLTLETSRAGYQAHSRSISLTENSTVVVTLANDSAPNNSPLIANAGVDQIAQIGEMLVFDGSLSRDPDFLSFSWEFGDGTPAQSGISVNHTYHSPGTFMVMLTVSDGRVSVADSAVVTVQVPSGGTSIHDEFDRADASTLGAHWKEVQGDLQINNQKLNNVPEKGQHMAVSSLLYGSVQDVAADFTSFKGNAWRRFGLLLRYRDPLNYYLLYRQAGSSSIVRISKVIDGQETILSSLPIKNPKNGEVFRLGGQAIGTQVTLELAGEPLLAVSDSTFPTGSLGVLLGVGRAMLLEADNFSGTIR